MERKTLPFSLKQEPDSLLAGVVEGYAAVFGNVDDGNDLIDPGAFAKTITENGGRIKMGWHHAAPSAPRRTLPRSAAPPYPRRSSIARPAPLVACTFTARPTCPPSTPIASSGRPPERHARPTRPPGRQPGVRAEVV